MNKYPLCRGLGLKVKDVNNTEEYFVYAEDLEAILQKATVVDCRKPDKAGSHLWTEHPTEGHDTHTALLINIQPIKEKTTLEKISDEVKHYENINSAYGFNKETFQVMQKSMYEIKKPIEQERK